MVSLIEVKVEDSENIIPFDCPTCGVLMRDRIDSFSFLEYACCSECKEEIAYPNKKKWKNGWRPSGKQLRKLRKKRTSIPSYIKL
ncbi:hypothetical protein CL634_04130 [bacterium]|nr:hypothetical protein [bacterium]|tara:strand:+ start:1921 stop:2175 length:255 start_codon:yes stop_codon:yes gene_type:complete